MFDSNDNPILAKPYEAPAQTQVLTCGETQSQTSKVPAAIRKIVSELGLRYRPSAQADLGAHAAALALLASDLADLPPHLLERAARDWAVRSPYLPKASDLAAMCREMMAPAQAPRSRDDWLRAKADEYNRELAATGRSDAMLWVVDGAGMRLVDPKYYTQEQAA